MISRLREALDMCSGVRALQMWSQAELEEVSMEEVLATLDSKVRTMGVCVCVCDPSSSGCSACS